MRGVQWEGSQRYAGICMFGDGSRWLCLCCMNWSHSCKASVAPWHQTRITAKLSLCVCTDLKLEVDAQFYHIFFLSVGLLLQSSLQTH